MSSPLITADSILRERVYVELSFTPAEFERTLLQLHEARATGTLMIDLSQGGVSGVRFFREDRKRANESDNNLIY